MKIILASGSPRRREILESCGFEVTVVPSAEEAPPPSDLSPEEKAEFLALEKGLEAEKLYPDRPVLSADTIVVLGDEILGKPKDESDAVRMLGALSGKTHRVISAYTLFYKGKRVSRAVTTEVVLFDISDKEIEEYVASGQPMDKAGAYGIQGPFGKFVKEIRGDYYNVVGLPISRVYKDYKELF